MGTTATGKTDAAAAFFDRYDAEIISVDSSLVYQGMNIGTAKPDNDFLAQYPHHLVDIRHPNQTYSVADFYQDAMQTIAEIQAKDKFAVLVGGTHFYYAALSEGLSQLPKANPELRQKITEQAQQRGWPKMHQKLEQLDPESAARIDANDAQRIQRALEIVLESGETVAWHNQNRKPPLAAPMLRLALAYSDRQYLHQRIELRFDQMLEQGLQSEVEELLSNGVDQDCTAMKMIGYRQMLNYLKGDCTKQQMREQGIAATRQLAKRQLTWLRNQPRTVWWTDFGLKNKNFEQLVTFAYHFAR